MKYSLPETLSMPAVLHPLIASTILYLMWIGERCSPASDQESSQGRNWSVHMKYSWDVRTTPVAENPTAPEVNNHYRQLDSQREKRQKGFCDTAQKKSVLHPWRERLSVATPTSKKPLKFTITSSSASDEDLCYTNIQEAPEIYYQLCYRCQFWSRRERKTIVVSCKKSITAH